MSTFVLIHGAASGGWIWYKVVPLLEKQGHTVVAPDLPSHGRDKTPIAAVSLQVYVDSVCRILDAQREPVILVGHSMGGGVITQTAEYRPDKIKTLVYVAALLPRNGESMLQIVQRDTESLLLPNTVFAEDQRSVTFREEALKEVAYGDCSEEDMALVKALLVPQAVVPLTTPITTTAANSGRLPRVYIECLQDRALSLSLQKILSTAFSYQKVISMDTSHSPFFSAPEELAEHLGSL